MAQDVGLFVVLVILFNGLAPFPSLSPPTEWMATFYLAFFVHAGVSLYLGIAGSLRTATWLLLIATWAGSELIGFAGYVLPWGMMAYWLAGIPVIGTMAGWLSDSGLWPMLVFLPWSVPAIVLLGFDLAVMHHPAWRGRPFRLFAAMVIGAGAAAIAPAWLLSGLLPASAPTPSGPDILPSWHTLPLYTVLRAVSGKLAGVIVVFAALIVPLIWPWVRADALRIGPVRWAWRLSCVALAATWLGLGYLGTLPPDGTALLAARAGTAYYFAFFLLIPFILLRLSRLPAGRPF